MHNFNAWNTCQVAISNKPRSLFRTLTWRTLELTVTDPECKEFFPQSRHKEARWKQPQLQPKIRENSLNILYTSIHTNTTYILYMTVHNHHVWMHCFKTYPEYSQMMRTSSTCQESPAQGNHLAKSCQIHTRQRDISKPLHNLHSLVNIVLGSRSVAQRPSTRSARSRAQVCILWLSPLRP